MCKRSSNAAFLVSALMLVLVWGPVLQAELPDAVGLWTFQGDASDSGTGGNDGQLVGDAAIVRDPERGQCLELAGDGYAEIDSGVAELGAASFTIGAWIQTSDISLCVLSKSDGDPSWESMEKQLYVNAVATGEGGVDGSVDYVGWGCDWVRGSITVDDGLWHHVCVTWDGTTGHAYVDGEEGTGELGFNGGGDNDGDTVRIGFSPGEHSDHFLGRIDDVAIFDVALSPEQVIELMTIAGGPENAANPSPADEQQDVPIDVVLSWTPGEFAHTHNVYFGTGFDDVNEADTGSDLLVGPGQTDTSYDPDRPLDFGQTYYWRVDEVNAAPDNAVFKGAVWSFTVEPFAYPIAAVVATSNATSDAGVGPERTVDGSGLDADDQHSTVAGDMWLGVPSGADPIQLEYEFDRVYKLHQMLVWNYNVQFELMLGFGLEDVTVEYSENGTDWTVLGDVV
ncbi:MAG: LamG domain-containing protein, partial [Planctomycetota bacterium]